MFQKAGVPTPKSFLTTELEEGLQFANEIGYPVILKLPKSTNSQSVTKVNREEEFVREFNRIQQMYEMNNNRLYEIFAGSNVNKSVMIQEYVKGLELNIDLLYNFVKFRAIGVFEKAPMDGPYFAESQSIYPVSLNEFQINECIKTSIRSVEALGATIGVAHVELRLTQKGPMIIETALRPGGAYTAVAIERLHGINVFQALSYLLSGGNDLPLVMNLNGACLYGGVVLSKKGIIKSVSGLEIFREIKDLIDYQVLKKVGDEVTPLPIGSDYHLVHFILTGNRREEVLLKAKQIREAIHVEIEGND